MNKVLSVDPNVIEIAVKILKEGGLLIYPTETAYGVGVDATNKDAVSKLLKYKKRPEGKAISVGCSSKDMAGIYVEINETAENLYEQFLPGPVTVISKSKGMVDSRLESENGTLGIRIPDQKIMLEVIEKFGKPVTTTSANSAGKKTPYSVTDVLDTLSEKQISLIDLIIDGGTLPRRQTSAVVDTTTDSLKTYRQGEIEMNLVEWEGERVVESEEEMINKGEEIMESIFDQDSCTKVVLLRGKLGAGKTYFTKGVARALGIERTIKSPTYNYVSEYPIPEGGKLYHMDAWRISSKDDLALLKIDSWFEAKNVLVIEWPDILLKIDPDLKKALKKNKAKIIDIQQDKNDSTRTLRIGQF